MWEGKGGGGGGRGNEGGVRRWDLGAMRFVRFIISLN